MGAIKILLVDDHAIMREGLRELLEHESDLLVVGDAGGGEEAVAKAEELSPDVVLMDVHMKPVDGITATRQITTRNGRTRVVVLTMDRDDDTVFEAIKAGAQGYLVKDARSREVVETIRAVCRGEIGMSRALAEKVLEEFRRMASHAPPKEAELTDRDRELLTLVARGATNAEIGARFCLSEQTIKNTLSKVYDKLHVHNRAAAVAVGLREGIVQRSEPPDGDA